MPLPRFLAIFTMKLFVKNFKINMDEAEKPIESYKNIGDLFVRKLKPGLRPLSEGVIHPADSHITFRGEIKENQVVYAKDMKFSLQEFLKQENLDDQLIGGHYVTYYLCPTDYHRVHSPIEAELESLKIIPGALWPVNQWSTDHINGLFALNERAILTLKTDQNERVYFVMVGATNVGQMEFSFEPNLSVDHFKKEIIEKTYSSPLKIKKGQDLGAFKMGSTVIMLYPNGYLKEFPQGEHEIQVQMGGALISH